MITSKDILEATGLKSAKTLTRWHQRGLIPEPLVRTHPSGRGKIAYWPEWVLDRCVKIVGLQKVGYSLESAARILQVERFHRFMDQANSQPASVSELLANERLQFSPGVEDTMLDAFVLGMTAALRPLMTDPEDRLALLQKLKEQKAVDRVLNLAMVGYNPILVYDGEVPEIHPDFFVGFLLSEDIAAKKAFFVAPILPALRKFFPGLDEIIGASPTVWPAPKIWAQDGDATMEYVYCPGGPRGFEVFRETAKVISMSSEKVGTDAQPDT